MRFQKKVSKKEFAREILVGSMTLACLFAIFLFVAIHKATGKNLSPLTYLWPKDEKVNHTAKSSRLLAQHSTPSKSIERPQEKSNSISHNAPERNRFAPEAKKWLERNPNGISSDIGPSNLVQQSSPNKFLPKKTVKTERNNGGSFAPRRNIELVNHVDDGQLKDVQAKNDHQFDIQDQTAPPSSTPKNRLAYNNKVVNDDLEKKPAVATSQFENVVTMSPTSIGNLSGTLPAESNSALVDQVAGEQNFSPTTKNKTLIQDQNNAVFQNRNLSQKPTNSNTFSNVTQLKTVEARTLASKSQVSGRHSGKLATATKNSLRVSPKQSDSYWTLSQEYYGDGKYFDQLARFNSSSEDSDNLPKIVLVPSLVELQQLNLMQNQKASSPVIEKGIYLTGQGETLFDIAKERLGSAARYVDLLKLNQGVLPGDCDAQTKLRSGIRLQIPNH